MNKDFYKEIELIFYHLVGGKFKIGNKIQNFQPLMITQDNLNYKSKQQFAIILIEYIIFC